MLLICLMMGGCTPILIELPPVETTPTPTPKLITQYEFVSFDFLYEIITVELGVQDVGEPNPKLNPAGYLYTHRHQLGEPSYTGDSETTNPGRFTAPGMKAWIVSSSNACALAMDGEGWKHFNSGTEPNIDKFFLHWLARFPTQVETDVINESLDELEVIWSDIRRDSNHPRWLDIARATQTVEDRSRRKTMFLCSTVLNSMEFLSEN